jgi:hypothetical protein
VTAAEPYGNPRSVIRNDREARAKGGAAGSNGFRSLDMSSIGMMVWVPTLYEGHEVIDGGAALAASEAERSEADRSGDVVEHRVFVARDFWFDAPVSHNQGAPAARSR